MNRILEFPTGFQISHFLCELALEKIIQEKKDQAIKHLEQALDIYKNSTRANIILGELEFEKKTTNLLSKYGKELNYKNQLTSF